VHERRTYFESQILRGIHLSRKLRHYIGITFYNAVDIAYQVSNVHYLDIVHDSVINLLSVR